MVKFDSLNLSQPVLSALQAMGFEEASPIQVAVIPSVMAGRDVVGQAQTGTGKTAAFGIPLVEAAINGGLALVLVPTRELAQQVAAECERIGKVAGIRALPVYGGASFGEQARAIERSGASIIVATPGRLRDHLARGTLDVSTVGTLVLDEADEMLDMGFLEEVEEILLSLPKERKTLLFSATMAEPIVRLAEKHLKDPEYVQVAGANESVANANTEQFAVGVRHNEKLDAFLRILAVERPSGTLVFRHTRETVDELVGQLRSKGIAAEALHGGMAQNVRDTVLGRFRDGRVKVLVATNVAARGLDVDSVSHVVNYDAPREVESYVHRIGRTGRAGREGRSFLFVTPADSGRLRGIERVIQTRLAWYQVPSDKDVETATAKNLSNWLTKRAGDPLDLDSMFEAVDAAVEAGHDIRKLAAVALLTVAKHEGFETPRLDIRREQRGPAPREQSREPRERRVDERPPSTADKVALCISVGRDDGVRPGDLVGALTNEGGLTGADIGRIDILPRMSVAEVPSDRITDLMNNMSRAVIRGVNVEMRVAEQWQFRAPPKGGAGRPQGRPMHARREHAKHQAPYGRRN